VKRAGAILAAAALCACGDGGGETGIDLSIRYDPELRLERFALTAAAGGDALIERTLLPDGARPLDESGREGVLLLVPDSVPGGEVEIRVDGLVRGDVVASGTVTVRVAAGELTAAEVTVRPPGPAGCSEWEWAPSNVAPCEDGPPPDGALFIDRAGTWRLDTGDGRVTTPDDDVLAPASEMVEQAGGLAVRMLAIDELVVESGALLEVVGPHPLVLVVWGEASIAGDIDVAAGGTSGGGCSGPVAGGEAGDDESGAGGGGGGGFSADGGDGGDGHGDAKGAKGAKGRVAGDPMLKPLRGGCPGGDGGDAFGAAGSGGAGGRGGGAIQIAAQGTLFVAGSIRAAGSGGAGGSAASGAGGGGGGSGGAILLEAPTIRLAGGSSLCANGGSGGEGSDVDDDGSDGATGTCSGERAETANLAKDGGDGGRGSAGADRGGENAKAGKEGGAGGGGGGGIGRMRLRAIDDLIDLGALITPPAG
jgi:hypothetical protein